MKTLAFTAILSLALAVGTAYWALSCVEKLETLEEENALLLEYIGHLRTCDEALEESRRLFELQLKLRNNSMEEAQNVYRFDAREQYDLGARVF